MAWLSDNNKYLKVNKGVVLTPTTDASIAEVDQYFKDCPSFVTSALRDANDQLRVMRNYLVNKGLDKKYPNTMTCKVDDMYYDAGLGKHLYVWQYAWSNLLNLRVIINPPLAAQVLMDYFGPQGTSKNLKGITINQTAHALGKAYNIGGGSNGPQDEYNCIMAAQKAGCKTIVSFLLERENNALHVNCQKI